MAGLNAESRRVLEREVDGLRQVIAQREEARAKLLSDADSLAFNITALSRELIALEVTLRGES